MFPIDLSAKELAILEFVLEDLAEAIDDGDRPEFDAADVADFQSKVRALQPRAESGERTRQGEHP